MLKNAVQIAKVNCVAERMLCQREQIMKYPTLKLYLNKNRHVSFNSVIAIPVRDYAHIVHNVKSHLINYDDDLLTNNDEINLMHGINMKRDEL